MRFCASKTHRRINRIDKTGRSQCLRSPDLILDGLLGFGAMRCPAGQRILRDV
jgi:NAD(P)H-hydrate repair Nnr-like enzyme with NAD(P)H-hydrate epimerase domain